MTNPTRPAAPDENHHWPRRIALALLLVFGVVAGGYFGWGKLAERRLAQTVARYKAAGEPVTPADLTDHPVPEAVNAVPLLRAAAAALDPAYDKWVTFVLPPTEKEAAQLARLVGGHQPLLADVRQAAARGGVDWKVSYSSPMVQNLQRSDLRGQSRVAHVQSAAAIAAHLAGDDAEAARRVREILFVARAMERQPFLVSHLVALGIHTTATDTLAQLTPDLEIARPGGGAARGTPAAAEDVKALLAELLDPADLVEGQRRGLRGERVLQLDAAASVAAGRLSTSTLAGMGGTGTPAGPALKPLVLTDARLLADYMAGVIEAAGAPDLPAAKAKLPTALYAELKAGTIRHPFAALMISTFDRAIEQTYHHLTDRRLAAAAVAARWYALDHGGAAPGGWDDLVPAYLPAVPLDALSAGQPLHYLPGADPRFYSVGPDGVDDGGSEAPTKPNDPRPSDWTRKDRVVHLNRQTRPPTLAGEEQ